MGIKVAIRHRTAYAYDRPIRLGPQVVRLRPAPHSRTPIISYSLRVEPDPHFVNWQQDPQGNYLARLVFPERTRRLQLEVDLVAELTVVNPFDFFLEPHAETFPFEYDPSLRPQLAPYLETGGGGPRFEAFMARIDRSPRRTVDFLVEFNGLVNAELGYILRPEPGFQAPEETLERGRGSCRDFAWLEVQALRRLGLAARFVSGYSVQLRPDVKPLEGPVGVAQDVVDLHAWCEVYLPGAGWIGLDGTSALMTGEGHIPLACTPEPQAAAPVTGVVEECRVDFEFEMEVTRIADRPRSTLPYAEETWQAILARGAQVERRLHEDDVRLTMGGEPTFVSVDDPVGAEWNTQALGKQKRLRAEDLVRRLRRRFAAGGLLQYGQGKWYPGETLPRWRLECFWRPDGQAVWLDEAWIADPASPGEGVSEAAPGFARELAARLGAPPERMLPAYEDAAYHAWKEQRLPEDVDPASLDAEASEERARLARVLERGLGEPAGWVLPLERRGSDPRRWRTSAWPVRGGRLFLIPGDSPVGLRLPLDSLPESEPPEPPLDPTAPRGELPPRASLVEAVEERAAGGGTLADEPVERVVRTALSLEVRGGLLHVFLPPLSRVEDFLELVVAVELTAASLRQPVVVEGYPPPDDHRLRSFKLTPDPGVLEANVQPASDWNELVAVTTGLYDDAREARLGTEKYLVDGRVVGTGGGNHMVLGGPTPTDSPFLRRPDLLRSLIGFWVNHPSLSYLFSSLFLGPTSQAPRVDEARHDSLYELEIAFARVPAGRSVSPWLVDRLFRHLLVDVTGNTHRAEICIDKLYSPDSTTGRLGLVEFRSFEMPPHARMSVAQQLLLRGLVAAFWSEPYTRPMIRWGTRLHDRFMLPHFVWHDLGDALADLRERGVELERSWFEPHFEFRFPLVGSVAPDGIELELRQALEPWHVLGEEPAGGAMTRFVDSSVERLQARVTGLVEGRHRLACNGVEVPLHATGTPGEQVAGIRFRAWQPVHCLHPTIGVHTPLVFDLVDGWSERSLGGCTYYVGHPGGRSYDEPAVNSLEAESRRRARFAPIGHSPGRLRPAPRGSAGEFPVTLDLRRLS